MARSTRHNGAGGLKGCRHRILVLHSSRSAALPVSRQPSPCSQPLMRSSMDARLAFCLLSLKGVAGMCSGRRSSVIVRQQWRV